MSAHNCVEYLVWCIAIPASRARVGQSLCEIQDPSGGQESPRREQGTGGDPVQPGSILLTKVQRPD